MLSFPGLHLDVHLFNLLLFFRASLSSGMSRHVELVLHITQLIVQALDSLFLLLSLLFEFVDLEGLTLDLVIFLKDDTLMIINLFFKIAQLLLRCV